MSIRITSDSSPDKLYDRRAVTWCLYISISTSTAMVYPGSICVISGCRRRPKLVNDNLPMKVFSRVWEAWVPSALDGSLCLAQYHHVITETRFCSIPYSRARRLHPGILFVRYRSMNQHKSERRWINRKDTLRWQRYCQYLVCGGSGCAVPICVWSLNDVQLQ